jgi:predicted peroxiredoxin
MIHNTHGLDDVERASLAFVIGNTALASEQEAIMLFTLDGVEVPVKDSANGLQAQGFPPLSELIQNFVANGGEIWVCGACAKPRNIGLDELVDGSQIVGAATAVGAMVSGARTISF